MMSRLKGLTALRAAIDDTSSQISRKNSNSSSMQWDLKYLKCEG